MNDNIHHPPPSDTSQLTDGPVSERKLSYTCRNGFHDWCVGLPCECKCHLLGKVKGDDKLASTTPTSSSTSVTFEGNAARSHKAPRFDLIPFVVLQRLAARFEIGLRYGSHNWQTGGPEFKLQCALHLVEHLWNWIEGRPDEDVGTSPSTHLDAVLWNAAALVWYEARDNEKLKAIKQPL